MFQKSKRLQARTMIQQCIQAKVKVRPALDGVDAQWVEVGVHVCLFIYLIISQKLQVWCWDHEAKETYSDHGSTMSQKHKANDNTGMKVMKVPPALWELLQSNISKWRAQDHLRQSLLLDLLTSEK